MILRSTLRSSPGHSVRRRGWMLAAAGLLLAAACSSSDSDSDAGASMTATSEASAPDDAPTTTAPSTTSTIEAAPEYDFSAVTSIVQDFVGAKALNGAGLVIVEREEGVIHEEYWGAFGPDRISLIASAGKMISAGVLLRLQDDGLLDINAPVSEAVDWGAGNPEVTPAQLLSNSSGLVGLLPNPAYLPYLCQYLLVGSLQRCGESIFTTSADDDEVVPPDTEFRYGGAQWQVAGAVAEAVSGKSWAELIDEIYVEPCGLETLGFNNHFAQFVPDSLAYPTAFEADPATLAGTTNPNIEGGAYTTPRDYARLLLMHLRGGKCGDEQVLSQEALDVMHADRIGEVYGGDALRNTGYGMGWWVDRSSGRISDPGAYGALPWLDLDDGYGAYLIVESDTTNGAELAALLYDPVEEAVHDLR